MMTKEERAILFIKKFPNSSYAVQFAKLDYPALKRGEMNLLILKRLQENQNKIKRKNLRFAKRVKKLLTLKNSGKSLEEVGKIEGITRERVRQILQVGEKRGLGVYQRYKGLSKVERTCSTCKQKFLTYSQKFCSRKCYAVSHRKYETLEEGILANRAKRKKIYHTDSIYRKRHLELCMKRYHRLKHTPEYKERQRLYSKRHHEKKNGIKKLTPLH